MLNRGWNKLVEPTFKGQEHGPGSAAHRHDVLLVHQSSRNRLKISSKNAELHSGG